MAKRAASKQLTQDNWNDEDEEKETPGVYRSVDAAILQNRVIKKAKRLLPQQAEGGPSPFSQFSGFGNKAAKSQSFSFLKSNSEKSSSQVTSSEKVEVKQNGSQGLKTEAVERGGVSQLASQSYSEPSFSTKDSSSIYPRKCESRDVEYYRQLKALNESVFQWIEKHISKNPWCDFTPVFNDYMKHLGAIELKYPLKAKSSSVMFLPSPKPFFFKVPSAPAQKSSNVTHEEKRSSDEPAAKISKVETSSCPNADPESIKMLYGAGFKSSTTNTSTFSSGIKATTTATVPSSNSGPTSSCGSSEKDKVEGEQQTQQTPTFSFRNAKSSEPSSDIAKRSAKSDCKPFSFAVSPLSTPKESGIQPGTETKDDEEYVPPKNVVTTVKEEGAFYSKRCKLFYKRDKTDACYKEKGVGMLYLKPLEGSEGRSQLLIRADNNLGTILLNMRLAASLPMQRMGLNNVLVVCSQLKPRMSSEDAKVTETFLFLIRVKTCDDADELFEMMNKYKT